MDDDAAATTEQTQAAPEATESGAIAMGDGNTDYFAGMDVPSNEAAGDANANATEDASGQPEASDEKQQNDEPTFLRFVV